jgi:uncharacterized protein
MPFEWDETKRQANLKEHGIDFTDAGLVFSGLTFTYEGDRLAYQEQRFIALGLLKGVPVSICHTEQDGIIRPISFRRATTHETTILLEKIGNQLPSSSPDEGRRHRAKRRPSRGTPKAHRKGHSSKRPKGRPT